MNFIFLLSKEHSMGGKNTPNLAPDISMLKGNDEGSQTWKHLRILKELPKK